MATFLSLPSEILDDICHYLHANCLKSLSQTCAQLHPIVRRVLFQDVFAYPDSGSLQRAAKLAKLKGDEAPNNLVKSFTLSGREVPYHRESKYGDREAFKTLIHDINYNEWAWQRTFRSPVPWNTALKAYSALLGRQYKASRRLTTLLARCLNNLPNVHTIAFDAALDYGSGFSESNIPTWVPRSGQDGSYNNCKKVFSLFKALGRMGAPASRVKTLILEALNPEWIAMPDDHQEATPAVSTLENLTIIIIPDEVGPSHIEGYERMIRAVLAKTPSLITLDIRHRESKWPFPQNRPSNLYELASLSPTTWTRLRELRLCGWFSRAGMVSSLLKTMANTLKILYLEDIQLFPDLKVKDETEDNWAIHCQEWFPLLEWMAKKLTLSSLTLRGRLAEALFGTHVASPGEGFRARVERYVTRGGAAPFRMYQGLWRFECDATWMSTAVDSGGPPLENFWWVKGYQYADSSSDESDSD